MVYRERSIIIDRVWLSHLTPMEFCIVRFIFDRTAGWGKEWEAIPLRHFTEGVVTRNGQVHGKLNCVRKETVRAQLEVMAERGMILRCTHRHSFKYSLNYEWVPIKRGRIQTVREYLEEG